MDNSPDTGTADADSSSIIGYVLLFSAIFSLSWVATFGWYNRDTFIDLYTQANLERYQIATGDSGPATYHVYHTDFTALEDLSQRNDEILGIEMTRNSRIAAMAFTSQEVAAINLVRAHPAVSNMIRRNIPMICH